MCGDRLSECHSQESPGKDERLGIRPKWGGQREEVLGDIQNSSFIRKFFTVKFMSHYYDVN